MAALIARAKGARGPVSRLGHHDAMASVATWQGVAEVWMNADGSGTFSLRHIDGGNRAQIIHVGWGPQTLPDDDRTLTLSARGKCWADGDPA